MDTITIYTADCRENRYNTRYPFRRTISSVDDLREAVRYDQVFAEYWDSHRGIDDFIRSDCLPFDCDNGHSEDPAGWKTPDDVEKAFPGIPFYVVYSRSHMAAKNGHSARPRFHVMFPIAPIEDGPEYRRLKESVIEYFPYFDTGAKDAARFFFGVKDPQVEQRGEGSGRLDSFMADRDPPESELDAFAELPVGRIPEGRRNSTMSHIAGCLVKRYGDTPEAYTLFLEKAGVCEPPLDDAELNGIWKSAVGFGKKVAAQEGYVPPEEYNDPTPLKPDDYSDVGQAKVFSENCMDHVRYSPGTDYLVYDGVCWQESKPKAQAALHEFTDEQLEEAERHLAVTEKYMNATGAYAVIATYGKSRAPAHFTKEQLKAYRALEATSAYRQFVIKRRDSNYITATLKEARPMVEIEPSELDADGFLLNTPDGTVDLRKGLSGMREHRAEDFITKCTAVSPGDTGTVLWKDALNTFFCGDRELEAYVQRIAGLAVIGHVYVEALIIAHGGGRNGKSTFWNVLSRVLGSYSGNISADALTVGCKRNVKPELAETKGKRLLIAAELEEGMRLNTSLVKQFCSTDEIFAEKKYKDPFSFIPSHTLVLYTNHLPRVGANDSGTWRRLIVVPFNAKLEGAGDIKNYADRLFDDAGPAVLAWMIEGAETVIREDFRITQPECVRTATALFRENSDWLEHFLDECCEVDAAFRTSSGDVYKAYREYCGRTGEYARSTTDFYAAIDLAGFTRKRTKSVRIICGLRLKTEFEPFLPEQL